MDTQPDIAHEEELRRQGYLWVAGLDEAGRGAWAGPVFAGAVVLPTAPSALVELLMCVRDSKQLTPPAREAAFELILRHARYAGIGAASNEEVDRLGIAPATRLAWQRAIGNLPHADFLLLDAFPLPESERPQRPLVRGDARCLSIAAASVLAKVARDRHMRDMDEKLSPYGFARNKGYGTAEHRRALREHGPCELHRYSFSPVRALAQSSSIDSP